MRYVRKGSEPPEVSAWKALANADWQPSWDNLSKPQKPILLRSLAKEQGFICCYCEQRIKDEKDSHIEHLLPRSNPQSAHLALDYSNLLACCQGAQPKAPGHCGHLKDKHLIPVTPLMPDCSDYFEFTSAGEIRPSSDPVRHSDAKLTLSTLGLALPKLEALRKKAIEGAMEILDVASEAELQQFIAAMNQRDSQGCFTPFSTAIAQVLRQYVRPVPPAMGEPAPPP